MSASSRAKQRSLARSLNQPQKIKTQQGIPSQPSDKKYSITERNRQNWDFEIANTLQSSTVWSYLLRDNTITYIKREFILIACHEYLVSKSDINQWRNYSFDKMINTLRRKNIFSVDPTIKKEFFCYLKEILFDKYAELITKVGTERIILYYVRLTMASAIKKGLCHESHYNLLAKRLLEDAKLSFSEFKCTIDKNKENNFNKKCFNMLNKIKEENPPFFLFQNIDALSRKFKIIVSLILGGFISSLANKLEFTEFTGFNYLLLNCILFFALFSILVFSKIASHRGITKQISDEMIDILIQPKDEITNSHSPKHAFEVRMNRKVYEFNPEEYDYAFPRMQQIQQGISTHAFVRQQSAEWQEQARNISSDSAEIAIAHAAPSIPTKVVRFTKEVREANSIRELYVELQTDGWKPRTWVSHDPTKAHQKIFQDDSGLNIADKVEKTIIEHPRVYPAGHRGNVLKRVSENESNKYYNYPLKLRFGGKQFGHIRIPYSVRPATEKEASLLPDCKEIVSPKKIILKG